METTGNNSMDIENFSAIRDFYSGRSVFITGATGYMGKLLVEKLLRSCPGVKAIYILIRPLGETTVEKRIEEFISSDLFGRVRSECPDALNKIIPVEGDVSVPKLGISEDDEKILCDNVSIVMHLAACVHYYGRLKKLVNTNCAGTLRMIELCEKMKQLECFVYMSTLLVCFSSTQTEEAVFPTSVDPWNIIKCSEWMDNDMLEAIAPGVTREYVLPYLFSKAAAENIVLSKNGKFPIAIYRPGLVLPPHNEPYPGWVDNGNGLSSLFLVLQKGLLRALYLPPKARVPLIPGDVSINTLICIAWNTAKERSRAVKVYNCSSTTERNVDIRELIELIKSHMHNYPIRNMIWYPSLVLLDTAYQQDILIFLYLYLPALIADIFQAVTGKKRKFVKVYEKAKKVVDAFYIALKQDISRIDGTNTLALKDKLSSGDKHYFDYGILNLDEEEYTQIIMSGMRQYYLKEDPSTIPDAKKRLTVFYCVHIIFKYSILLLLGLVLYKVASTVL